MFSALVFLNQLASLNIEFQCSGMIVLAKSACLGLLISLRVATLSLIFTIQLTEATAFPVKEVAARKWAVGAMAKKLDSIVIPHVGFKDAALGEVMNFIRRCAFELDTSEIGNEFRGINVVVCQSNGIEGVRINCDLREVSLGAAIHEVAKQAKLRVDVDQSAICLSPSKIATEGNKAQVAAPMVPLGKAAETGAQTNIPRVSLADASLAEVVDFLNLRSAEVSGGSDMAPRIVFDAEANPQAIVKELSLRNVPLSEVLRYCCAMTGHRWTADDKKLIVKPNAK